jgi:hypothetical protein
MKIAASTLAAPRSPVSSPGGFHRGHRLSRDREPGQQRRRGGDGRHHEAAVDPHLQARPGRRNRAYRRRAVVSSGRQPGRFARRVDTPHLGADRRDAAKAQQQDEHQRRDGQGGLDGARPAVTGQTLVLSARVMMFVNAPTIESPVTTV